MPASWPWTMIGDGRMKRYPLGSRSNRSAKRSGISHQSGGGGRRPRPRSGGRGPSLRSPRMPGPRSNARSSRARAIRNNGSGNDVLPLVRNRPSFIMTKNGWLYCLY